LTSLNSDFEQLSSLINAPWGGHQDAHEFAMKLIDYIIKDVIGTEFDLISYFLSFFLYSSSSSIFHFFLNSFIHLGWKKKYYKKLNLLRM